MTCLTTTAKVNEVVGLREALERIKHELGVPGMGYPAPVANAWFIADAALQGHRFAFGCGDEQYASEATGAAAPDTPRPSPGGPRREEE